MKTKHIIFLSLALLISGVSSSGAQDSLLVNPAKIDSLQQLIDSRPNADEEKVRLLNEYARLCFYNEEYLNGFSAARDAHQLSKNLNFKGGEIMYYLTLAAFLGKGQIYDYQIERARNLSLADRGKLSAFFTELNIPAGYPPIYNELLLNKLTPVLQYFEKLDDKEIQLALLEPLGWSYFNTGRINEVKLLLKKYIQLSIELNQLYPESIAYSRLYYFAREEENKSEEEEIENKLIELLLKARDKKTFAIISLNIADMNFNNGNNSIAYEYYLKSADAFKLLGDLNNLLKAYDFLGWIYEGFQMNTKALETYEEYFSVCKKLNDTIKLNNAYSRPVNPLMALKRYDEAREYMNLALQFSSGKDKFLMEAKNNWIEGRILVEQGKYSEAIPFIKKNYEIYSKPELKDLAMYSVSFTLVEMAECYYKIGDIKSAQKYALESYKREYELNQNRPSIRSRINFLISEIYIELGQPDKAFEYIKVYQEITTEANKTENANKVAEAEIREVIAKNETQINQFEKERTQKIQESKIQRVWIFSITGALLSALLVAFILYRNNKIKQKANKLLQEQKEEIQTTLEQLKSTQSQLIQSEKMASLGELTAGIAHEIQNPLNFVNNFSEVSNELIVEIEEEMAKNPKSRDENQVSEILSDIKQNLEKINHHGKRAADIVKGMLQHSRTSSGQKEPTDINALADEYLRLAYHGLRAKDKSFNADFKTDFDPNLPKINVIPQDIGRVLLNLINNAFYAAPLLPQSSAGFKDPNYIHKPTVTVCTTSSKSPSGDLGVEIRVKDNGPGIPKKILDKIFQPFFTTKPTGQGTGLGLSLSYDIVKAHGGELKVETIEGEGTEFIIQLPIKS